MGIPGLTTYVANRSERYWRHYELHDSYLVIDGNSVACQIYNWHARCNCIFGGDYDKYGQCVSDFFDDLLKCKVTPLVLIDGGCENKKLKTVICRANEKIRTASYYGPGSRQKSKFFPLFVKEVFKDVMREKGVRSVHCLFEADNAIASVARILDCPVLSYDSDFYIYGTKYIPFNTLESYVVKRSAGSGYAKRCQIYEVEYLLKSFKGLDQSLLPLAALLLGNDYVPQGTFKNFYRHIKLPLAKRRKHNHQQQRIEVTLSWLSRYTLDKAVIRILCRLPKDQRRKVLDVIETNINSYTNASAEVLMPLGFSKEQVANMNTHSVNRTFKLDNDINNLTYIEETSKVESDSSEDEEEEDLEITNAREESELLSNNAFVGHLPEWFINDFTMGRFPAYFMDLIVRSLYVCPIQIEDYSYPSSILISLKIISMIYQLLISGINGKPSSMNYMIRGQNKQIVKCQLSSSDTVFNCKLPTLHNLREIPLNIRLAILNDTLGISDVQCINELLPEWMLYISTAKYWIDNQQQELFRSHCYVYSLLFGMLFNIVDCNGGRHRDAHNFQNKYCQTIASVEKKRKLANYQPSYSMDVSLAQAYDEIDSDDCLLACSFFVSHFDFDKKLLTNPKKFNKSVVHAFSEFQSCLRHSMNLNALLGYPYEQTKVAKLFNGTLLYNVYNNFRSRNNVDVYISTILKNSPSLLRLFNVLLSKVSPLFESVLKNRFNDRKRQRCEPTFHDANNVSSLLNSAR